MITLITRRDCHLCADMERVAREVAADLTVDVEVRDVDADPELRTLYDDSVPVLLVDGRKAFKYRVTHAALRRRLTRAPDRERGSLWRRVFRSAPSGGSTPHGA